MLAPFTEVVPARTAISTAIASSFRRWSEGGWRTGPEPRIGSSPHSVVGGLVRLEQAVLHAEQRRPGPGGHANLGVDVLHVVVGGLRGDEQAACHLFRREAPGQESKHLHLPVREPR